MCAYAHDCVRARACVCVRVSVRAGKGKELKGRKKTHFVERVDKFHLGILIVAFHLILELGLRVRTISYVRDVRMCASACTRV